MSFFHAMFLLKDETWRFPPTGSSLLVQFFLLRQMDSSQKNAVIYAFGVIFWPSYWLMTWIC